MLLGAAACDGSADTPADGRAADGRIVDASRDAYVPACDVTKPFGTPIPVAGVNSADHEKFGWLTADQRTIYFARAPIGTTAYDLHTATRAQPTGAFTGAAPLDPVNTIYSENRPIVSADGLTLYLEFVDASGVDIHYSTRSDPSAPFSAQQMSLAVVNTTTDAEFNPWISDDHKTMYFTSDRDGYNDIFMTTRTSTTTDFTMPVAVTELNSGGGDYMGALSADGLEIFFGSSRDTNVTNDDIFHATRATPSGPFGTPAKLTELSDATTDEYPTWLSADRCQLMFTSNRSGGSGGYNLWITTRPQ
jgi:hypothetical protein